MNHTPDRYRIINRKYDPLPRTRRRKGYDRDWMQDNDLKAVTFRIPRPLLEELKAEVARKQAHTNTKLTFNEYLVKALTTYLEKTRIQ